MTRNEIRTNTFSGVVSRNVQDGGDFGWVSGREESSSSVRRSR